MALTQMQIIQSLGEAMTWFERELHWGVPPTELRRLCGRIGELYAAMITNGQMALAVNQHGYDVVSAQGERISVKTTAKMDFAGHLSFNPRSLVHVDRVIVLRVNTEEMQVEILLDAPVESALALMGPETKGMRPLPLRRLLKALEPTAQLETVNAVTFHGYTVREMESGSILVERDGAAVIPAKPALRELALALNIGLLNSNGNALNTRQLGTQIIQSVNAIRSTLPAVPEALAPGSVWPV
ncbi:DUF6998 domain-containing protein [Pseudomonas frederiksbergensis]